MSLRQTLRRAARRALILWAGAAIAAVVVLWFPPYPRFY